MLTNCRCTSSPGPNAGDNFVPALATRGDAENGEGYDGGCLLCSLARHE